MNYVDTKRLDQLFNISNIHLSFTSIKESYFCFRREYSSEYRKSFRPFSQYEYIDGRFIPSVGFNLKTSAMAVANANKAASLHGEPWYQEVVELRRQAQDYKVSFYKKKIWKKESWFSRKLTLFGLVILLQ